MGMKDASANPLHLAIGSAIESLMWVSKKIATISRIRLLLSWIGSTHTKRQKGCTIIPPAHTTAHLQHHRPELEAERECRSFLYSFG